MLDDKKIYQTLQPELEKVDEQRTIYYKKVEPFRYTFWIIFIIGGSYLFYLINFPDDSLVAYLIMYPILSLLSLSVFLLVLVKTKAKYKTYFAEHIAPTLVRCFGPDFSYQSNSTIEASEIKESGLFAAFDSYRSEDFIDGTIDGLPVALMEMSLGQMTMINNQPSELPVFQGFYVRIELEIPFASKIWLTGNANATIGELKDEVTFDHTIEERCRIFADDPAFARKLLQPFILSRIRTLNEELRKEGLLSKKQSFSLLFSNQSTLVAIPSKKKLVEPKLGKTFDSESFIKKQTFILRSIFLLIDELRLSDPRS